MILSSRLPLGADLFIHPQRRQLVDGNDHRLALIAAMQEIMDHVLRHRVQPVLAGDQVIALAQRFAQLLLLVVVQPGVLDPSGIYRSYGASLFPRETQRC